MLSHQVGRFGSICPECDAFVHGLCGLMLLCYEQLGFLQTTHHVKTAMPRKDGISLRKTPCHVKPDSNLDLAFVLIP